MATARSREQTTPPQIRSPFGRAFLGMAFLGWGLSIVLGVTPHESRLVGTALAVFGAALLATSPRLPEFRSLPAWAVGALGLLIVAGLVGHTVVTHNTVDVQKVALVALGLALVAATPFLNRRLQVPRSNRTIAVGSIVVMLLAILGAPLAAWGVQAIAKATFASTPTEAFVRHGLVLPSGLLLTAFGFHPTITDQTIRFGTPNGLLTVEVGAACSGIQAMALFMGVLAAYLWSEKPSGPRLALWSIIGLGGVYLTNLLRLQVLFLVGYRWGSDALLRAHAQAGWIFFAAWALAFAALTRHARSRA